MNSKRRTHTKSRLRKGVILPVLGVAAVICLITISFYVSPRSKPIDANTYFKISDIAATARIGAGTNNTIIISELGFSFTPVGGNAHDVEIYDPQADPYSENPYSWDFVTKGNSTPVDLPFSGLGKSSVYNATEDGYPVALRFSSIETQGGNMMVRFVIPKNQTFIISGGVG